jgi:hypothetical protein
MVAPRVDLSPGFKQPLHPKAPGKAQGVRSGYALAGDANRL